MKRHGTSRSYWANFYQRYYEVVQSAIAARLAMFYYLLDLAEQDGAL